MSLNIKRLEVTVPFNLSDLNGDSSFKVFFDFVKSIEALAEKNKELCEVVEQKVSIKDMDAYEELINIKNKNKDLLDKDLLKKEKELFSKNIYEGSVSLLYNINFDNGYGVVVFEKVKIFFYPGHNILRITAIPTERKYKIRKDFNITGTIIGNMLLVNL